MTFTMRSYNDMEDYWRIREFLRQVMILNHRREYSWHVARLDYWWWFANPDLEKISPEENIFIWETGGGQIAGVLNPESRGTAFLHVHPGLELPQLESEMIVIAEERLAVSNKDDHRKVWLYIDSQDRTRQEILTRRGFHPVDLPGERETQHRRSLDGPLPEVPVIPGYAIRSQGDGLELLERCYASGLAFHQDDIQVARVNRDRPDWYHHIQSAPLYRRDLDLVAVASNGSVASFCTIWFDDVTRTAYFEPVATVPAHQRHGLARALMLEGLHRLQKMGCVLAFVGGYSEKANALYFSVMGPECDVSEPWEKVF